MTKMRFGVPTGSFFASTAITFYPGQRRYLRIETDAHSHYHNPNDPARSRINLVVSIPDVGLKGTTPLEGGRMRAIFESGASASVGRTGTLRVELMRAGQPLLADERQFRIVEPPPAQPTPRRLPMPEFRPQPVNGLEDPLWNELGWPDNDRIVASSAEMSNGVLVIYYSTVFPKFVDQHCWFERRDAALAESFQTRYVVWLAAHSLLLYQAQQDAVAGQCTPSPESDDASERQEREERCRIATLASLFAAREVQLPASASDDE